MNDEDMETTLFKSDNKKDSYSVKTTFPRNLTKQWNLKAGDKLVWSLGVDESGEIVALVRPAGSKKRIKKTEKVRDL